MPQSRRSLNRIKASSKQHKHHYPQALMTWISFLHYRTRRNWFLQQEAAADENVSAHTHTTLSFSGFELMNFLWGCCFFSSGAQVDSDTNGSAPDLAAHVITESWLTCRLVGSSDPLPAWWTARRRRAARYVRFTLRRRLRWSNSLEELIFGGLAIIPILIITLCTLT